LLFETQIDHPQITLPSSIPPPIVPAIRPEAPNKAELPAFCGVEPVVFTTVASTGASTFLYSFDY
jgi:hypothetical protein